MILYKFDCAKVFFFLKKRGLFIQSNNSMIIQCEYSKGGCSLNWTFFFISFFFFVLGYFWNLIKNLNHQTSVNNLAKDYTNCQLKIIDSFFFILLKRNMGILLCSWKAFSFFIPCIYTFTDTYCINFTNITILNSWS